MHDSTSTTWHSTRYLYEKVYNDDDDNDKDRFGALRYRSVWTAASAAATSSGAVDGMALAGAPPASIL